MRLISWIFILLFVIGVGHHFLISPLSIIGPLLIAGIIYYLYRYPPKWLFRMSGSTSKQPQTKKKRKNPFKVISGKK